MRSINSRFTYLLTYFLFSSQEPVVDGRTDRRAMCVLRPIWQLHYN